MRIHLSRFFIAVVTLSCFHSSIHSQYSQVDESLEVIDITVDEDSSVLNMIEQSLPKEAKTPVKRRKKKKKDKYQKTEGIFVNATIYGVPFGLDVGKRISKNFNLGGQIGYLLIYDKRREFLDIGGQIGVGAYAKYFLSKDQSKSKAYIEGVFGASFSSSRLEGTNNTKPYTSLALGWQLASRKKIRFYFEFGISGVYFVNQEIIRNPNVTVITDKYWSFAPQFTLIGLEF